jgi:hypothetical protein
VVLQVAGRGLGWPCAGLAASSLPCGGAYVSDGGNEDDTCMQHSYMMREIYSLVDAEVVVNCSGQVEGVEVGRGARKVRNSVPLGGIEPKTSIMSKAYGNGL